MRLQSQRLTTLLLVAAYLAATTLGDVLHEHRHHDGDACLAGTASEAFDGSSPLASDQGDGVVSLRKCSSGASHDDECVICRFVGQRSLPIEIATFDPLCELVGDLTLAAPARPSILLPLSARPRAPPLCG